MPATKRVQPIADDTTVAIIHIERSELLSHIKSRATRITFYYCDEQMHGFTLKRAINCTHN